MAQFKTPCLVTSGSNTVTAPGQNIAYRILRNHIFMVDGELVPYNIAADASFDGTNTVFHLSGNYVGTTRSVSGVLAIGFTYPDNIPTLAQGDVGTAAIFTRAMHRIQDMVTSATPGGWGQFADALDEARTLSGEAQAAASAAQTAVGSINTQVADVAASADAAELAQTASESSATSALGAKTDAETAAATATTKAGESGASATLALGAKTDAETAAATATTKAGEAGASATSALGAKTDAETAAATATTKAGEAGASATSALGAKTAAETAAATATTKAGEASGFADSAEESAIAAALSAQQAGAGQVNADWNATSGIAMILNKPAILGTAADFGLGNVDNTSDADKPISTATQTALDGKAATSHNHDATYEPKLTKTAGYLTWTGTAWSFKDETYSLSTHNHTGTYQPAAANLTDWAALAPSAKQDELVSAGNIKTINGESILGSGDITIASGGSLVYAGVSGTTQSCTTGNVYSFNNASASTGTLPVSPENGDAIGFDAGNNRTDNIINPNGKTIRGSSENMKLDMYPITLVYRADLNDWRFA